MRPLIPIVCVIVFELALLPPTTGSVIKLVNAVTSTWFTVAVCITPGVLFLAALFKKKRGAWMGALQSNADRIAGHLNNFHIRL